LDESGDLGLKGSNYFVITLILLNHQDCLKLEKIIKKVNQKFDKKLKNINEIKATKIHDKIKFQILKEISSLKLNSYSIIFNKREINNLNWIKYKNKNEIYINIASNLVLKANIQNVVSMKFDRFVPHYYRDSFKEKILKNLKYNESSKLSFVDSKAYKGIQVADIISWCVFQNFENNESKYINKIENNIHLFKYKNRII